MGNDYSKRRKIQIVIVCIVLMTIILFVYAFDNRLYYYRNHMLEYVPQNYEEKYSFARTFGLVSLEGVEIQKFCYCYKEEHNMEKRALLITYRGSLESFFKENMHVNSEGKDFVLPTTSLLTDYYGAEREGISLYHNTDIKIDYEARSTDGDPISFSPHMRIFELDIGEYYMELLNSCGLYDCLYTEDFVCVDWEFLGYNLFWEDFSWFLRKY